MKKTIFLAAAFALSLSASAFAGEKIPTEEKCCRSGDKDCTEVYVAGCNEDGKSGHFCSSAKNEAGTSLNYRVVWNITCADNEECKNNDGNISCSRSEASTPDDVPTGACEGNIGACSEKDDTVGYYCDAKENVYRTKFCYDGKTCYVKEGTTSVQCIAEGQPVGSCDPAEVMGQCSADKKTGYYCSAKGNWAEKTCTNADCVVNDKVNSVSCGDSSGGNTNPPAGEPGCSSATEGWYYKGDVKTTWTCSDAGTVCGTKVYQGNKRVACCKQEGSGWVDAKYTSDTCDYVYGQSGSVPGGDTKTCTEANHCSADGKLAYNCANGTMTPVACLDGKSCQMDGDTAKCVGSINPGSNNDSKDDDDSGCSATGAGLMLGWLGLALVPALRRRRS